jgi:ornithine decarboxylase
MFFSFYSLILKAEIESVFAAGVDPSRIIYANPCKQSSHIKFASSNNVSIMTFDNADELFKIRLVAPTTKLVLRILTDDSKSICRFGIKFGASLSIVPHLLQTAKDLKLDVIGISFHVGSGCYDASAFADAVRLAKNAFDIGAALGFNFNILDIGGGFPGANPSGLQFEEIANLIRPLIDDLFSPAVRVVAEPGRFFASAAYTLAVNIIARRVIPKDVVSDNPKSELENHPSFMCKSYINFLILDYINDGMYGSFNCITFDHAVPEPRPFYSGDKFLFEVSDQQPSFPCSIWGPTCDSIDLIGKNFSLPEMNIGDWVVFDRMGAYTMAAASNLYVYLKPVL